MSETWKPGQYHDSYRQTCWRWSKKVKAKQTTTITPSGMLFNHKFIDFDQASR